MPDSEIVTDEQKEEVRMHVGTRIKQARKRRGVRQKEVEEDIELHANTLRRYEQGETDIPLPRLLRLSAYLDTPLAFFLQDVSDDQPLALDKLEEEDTDSWLYERERSGSRQLIVSYDRLPDGVEDVEVGLSIEV